MTWIREEDLNTIFFCSILRVRYKNNFISCVKENRGMVEDVNGVKKEVNKFCEGRIKEKNFHGSVTDQWS